MECSFCGRQPVIHQRYSGVYRCDRCLVKSMEKRFRHTITDRAMISARDRVSVAVSGGKDSVALMHLLADYSTHKNVELAVLTIDEGISGYRDESLKFAREGSKELGLEHVVISFEEAFGETLDQMAASLDEAGKPDTCTYCGVLRRSLLNQAARELKADKLAMAHNLDDEVQTIMLNYIRGDLARLSRFDVNPPSRGGFVPRIKPLCDIPEKEVTIYVLLQDFRAQIAECPYISGLRTDVRDFVNELEVNHPTTKFKISRMFDKLKPYLPDVSEGFELKECEICGEPTPGGLCRVCELLDNLGLQRKKTLISEKELKGVWRRARLGS